MLDTKYYFDDVQCRKCILWETSEAKDSRGQLYRRAGIYGRGTGKNGLLILDDHINARSVLFNNPLADNGGALLSNLLIKNGIKPEDCYLTTLMRCKCPGNRKPKMTERRFCQDNNIELDVPNKGWIPKLILLLGGDVLQAFTKEQKITERRGQFFNIEYLQKTIPALATFHPSSSFYTPKIVDILDFDVRRISEFLQGIKYDYLPEHNRIFIKTKEEFIENINNFSLLKKDTLFYVDIETSGLNKLNDDIVSISITYQENEKFISLCFITIFREIDKGEYFLDLQNKNSDEFNLLKIFLENKKLVFHNGDFDVQFIWRYGINCNYNYDTIDAHLLLQEEPPHKLKYLVKKYIAAGAGYEKDIQDATDNEPGQYKDADKQILLTYNSDDTFFTGMLFDIFKKDLQNENLYDFYENHAMPLRKVMTRVSYRGILIDKNKLINLAKKYRQEIQDKRKELFILSGKEFNESSVDQIRELLYDNLKLPVLAYTEKGSPSTDKDTLEILAKQSPVVSLLTEIRHLKKMCSTYLDGKTGVKDPEKEGNGILKYTDKRNRIHSSFFTEGTNSGRLSSRSPNCFSLDTEILTKKGWRKYNEIDYSTDIAAFNGYQIVWEKPLSIYLSNFDEKNMVEINNQHIHMRLTDNHRVLYVDRKTNKTKIIEAKNFPSDKHILHGIKSNFINLKLDFNWIRLLVAIQADAHIVKACSKIHLEFHKERKYLRLMEILDNLQIYYQARIVGKRFKISISDIKDKIIKILGYNKTFPIEWLSMGQEERKVFLEEIFYWDGCFTRKQNYSSNNEYNVDFIQALCALHGWRAHKRIYKTSTGNNNFQLDIKKNNYSGTSNVKINKFISNEQVWCVKVPSDTILVRRNSDTFISKNCQNIPKESEIRNIFVAPPGWKLIEIDLSTAELVLLAYLSKDANFIKAVNERDLHSDVARALLGISEDEKVDDKIRTLAKRINFRKAYRGGPKGLSEEMNIPLEEAYLWYNKWDESFPNVIKWFAEQDAFWKKNGYVESVFGRKRRFPDYNYLYALDNDAYRAREAYYCRIAANFPCQSPVADITNKAIYTFERILDEIFGPWFPDESIYERPGVILTVHDSVIVECAEDIVEEMADLLQKCLSIRIPKLNISLKSDIKISDCWMQKEE